jgi:hypothetical protein
MKSFRELLSELKEAEYEIISAGGEVDEGYDALVQLVENKAIAVAHVLDQKVLDKEVERLKQLATEITKEAVRVQSKKEFLQGQLHLYLAEHGNLIIGDKEVIPTLSISHTVDGSKLKDEEKKWKLTVRKLSDYDYKQLACTLEMDCSSVSKYDFDLDVGVKDLPEGHPALIEKLKQTIRTRKAK